jgi:mycoredoxin
MAQGADMPTDDTQPTLYGTHWCGASRRVQAYLDQHQVAYRFVDIDADPAGAAVVEKLARGFRSVPTIVFLDGSCLVEPSLEALIQKLGRAAR